MGTMGVRRALCVVAGIFACLIAFGVCSAELESAAPERTALVLGGGGARGAAHIGVLQVLEREHIPVDCVVGTSMGALVAGAYASGLSTGQMRAKLAQADWKLMFLDAADYAELSYRRKQITRGLLQGTEVGLTKKGAQLTPGVVAGENIKLFFNQLIGDDQGERRIENLGLPLAIVATDIGTGKSVLFKSGSLSQAMRASMSVPGLMAPVEYQGHKLVDGGLVDNLPVEAARELCKATRVIAVNVGSPLKPAEEVGSLLSVTAQMIGILTQQNVERSIASLAPGDVYIAPELGELTAADFALYDKAIALGRSAAEQHLAELKAFQVQPMAYQHWREQLNPSPRAPVVVDEIVISPLKRVNDQFVAGLIRQQTGQPLDRVQLESDLTRIYGEGYFDSVDYRVTQVQGRQRLEVRPREKNWSADVLTFGFNLVEEYREGAGVNLRSAYRATWLNAYGGEFFAVADLGSDPSLDIDFYQPLNPAQTYFFEPRYVKARNRFSLYEGERKLVEFKLNTTYSELVLGRNMGTWGQARAGWRKYQVDGNADVSAVQLPSVDEEFSSWLAEVLFDQRDRLYFPTRGWNGNLSYFNSAQQNYQKLEANISGAYSLGDYVFGARASYEKALSGDLPIFDSAILGGFLNMSAYATDQLWARGASYAQLRAERIIGRMPLGLSGDLRMGLGLESAQLNEPYTLEDSAGEDLYSAVIYFGGETPMGPAYLGYGFDLEGNFNIYFRLGAL